MPKNKIIKKDENDKFYTNPTVAKICYNITLKYVSENELMIEPSAGDGSFYNIMRNPKIGYDILPDNESIIKGNWFDQVVPKKSIILGNPPFGNRNDLSKSFIKHSLNNAKCIAFILPMVFKKETLQSVFPNNWSLVEEYVLPKNSFIQDKKEYHVPCVFQVWVNKEMYDNTYDDLRESIKEKKQINDFWFLNKKDNPTYFLFGAAPTKIIDANEVNSNNRGYYINVINKEVIEKIKNINWNEYSLSSVNGGVSWFTKQQIIDAYYNTYYA